MNTSDDLKWTPEAEQYIEDKVPGFVQKMAIKKIEKKARKQDKTTIDLAFVKEVGKNVMG